MTAEDGFPACADAHGRLFCFGLEAHLEAKRPVHSQESQLAIFLVWVLNRGHRRVAAPSLTRIGSAPKFIVLLLGCIPSMRELCSYTSAPCGCSGPISRLAATRSK